MESRAHEAVTPNPTYAPPLICQRTVAECSNASAIFAFSRRTDRLTGPAKVIDGDTIVVAGQLVRLHGIDAPELDHHLSVAGQHGRLTLNLQNRARPQRGIRFARDRHGVGAGRCLWARAGGRVAADAWSPPLAAR